MALSSPQRRRAFACPAALLALAVSAGAAPTAAPRAPRMLDTPLTFEQNTGHFPSQVKFVARSGDGTLFLTNREVVLSLTKGDRATALRLRLQGSNAGAIAYGLGRQPGIVNYFIGNDPKQWRTSIPTYSRVRIAGVYPGIDLVTYGAGRSRTLEYDFVLKPGADPSRIRMAVSGARSLRTVGGRIIASTDCGDVALNRPFAYQTLNGVRKQVACSFVLERSTVALQVARYDATRPLVVDPVVEFGTFIGGVGDDQARSIALDSVGAAYVTGSAVSTDFPATGGAYDTSSGGLEDVFITKLAADGASLVYSTYLGGSSSDVGYGIAVDSAGAATVTGSTQSTAFPTTVGAIDTSHNRNNDVIVTKINADGSSLVYSTFLGGTGSDLGYGVALDSTGAATVTGCARPTGFPTTVGAFDTSANGNADVFVAKLRADGKALVFSTYLGGSGIDIANAIALDSAGAAYITGNTTSSGFPTTAGSFDTTFNGLDDTFIAKVSSDGASLVYSTYLGGSGTDYGSDIEADATGTVTVAGLSASTDFPTTAGAYDRTNAGLEDAVVTRLSSDGASLVYSTYVGGSGKDVATGIVVDSAGIAGVTGRSTSIDFPTTASAFDTTHNGGNDAFVIRLSADGTGLDGSTYLGGDVEDLAQGIAIDALGALYVTGYTASAGFPTSAGAHDVSQNGSNDAFVVSLTFHTIAPTALAVDGVTGQVGERMYITATLTAGGSGVPGKTVTFTMPDATTIGRLTDGSGVADYYWDIPVCQANTTIGAAFAGDATHSASSGSGALTVTVASKVTVLPATAIAGQSTVVVAYLWDGKSMSGLTGRQLTLKVDGGAVGSFPLTAGAYGKATYAYAVPGAMAAGAHTTTVDWAGGGGYPASQGAGALTVNTLARNCIWVHSHGATRNQATRLTCYLYDYRRNGDLIPIPGKSITFNVAGTAVGSATTDSGGKAYRSFTPASAGALAEAMSFAGDAAFAAAGSTGTLTVSP